jgi:hypothetical protein
MLPFYLLYVPAVSKEENSLDIEGVETELEKGLN